MSRLGCAFLLTLFCAPAFGLTRSSSGCSSSPREIVVPTHYSTLQAALDNVCPGDTITLLSGVYRENVATTIEGEELKRITIQGPRDAVLGGQVGSSIHVFDIQHSYYTLDGFTIDGHYGGSDDFHEKLLYIQTNREEGKKATMINYDGKSFMSSINAVVIRNMAIRNALGECIRLRYYITYAHIYNNVVENCGREDFHINVGNGKNGEGIYVGTSSNQWDDGKNPTKKDVSRFNIIENNVITTAANECVDIKEGSTDNIVQHNRCADQRDPDSAGLDSRGDGNIFRFNFITGTLGAGVRLGGHTIDGHTFGVNNRVYGNTMTNNAASGIKIQVWPQSHICGNNIEHTTKMSGSKSEELSASSEEACSSFTPIDFTRPTTPNNNNNGNGDDGSHSGGVVQEGACKFVSASDNWEDRNGMDSNFAPFAVDGQDNTRWAANGEAVQLTMDLAGHDNLVTGVSIMFNKGNERHAKFDLTVFNNNDEIVSQVLNVHSSGTTLGYETFSLDSPTVGSRIVYTGRGYFKDVPVPETSITETNPLPDNLWNSLFEIMPVCQETICDDGSNPVQVNDYSLPAQASNFYPGKEPLKAADDKAQTRWKVKHAQEEWLEIPIIPAVVTSVNVLFFRSDLRTYDFYLSARSYDGGDWTDVLPRQASALLEMPSFEKFPTTSSSPSNTIKLTSFGSTVRVGNKVGKATGVTTVSEVIVYGCPVPSLYTN